MTAVSACKTILCCGVAALASLFTAVPVASAANSMLEGTWKISAPQSSLKTADGSPVPFSDTGRKQYGANKALAAKRDYESYDMTMARCSSPGLPRLMLTPDRFRIFVRPDVVSIMFEWNRLLRQINMRDKVQEPDWGTVSGQSWGRWEGDTLVVDSRGFSRKKLLDNLMPNSDDLSLVERVSLKDADTLEDRITIADPKIFTRSWETVLIYKRVPDEMFPEDVCLDRKAAGKLPLPK